MFREALASTEIVEPRIPVVSNVDAKAHSSPEAIRDILARQVKHSDSAHRLISSGTCFCFSLKCAQEIDRLSEQAVSSMQSGADCINHNKLPALDLIERCRSASSQQACMVQRLKLKWVLHS